MLQAVRSTDTFNIIILYFNDHSNQFTCLHRGDVDDYKAQEMLRKDEGGRKAPENDDKTEKCKSRLQVLVL